MGGFTEAVGKRLREYRIQMGLSQEKLAERAKLHPTYVGQVERGEKNLTLESLSKLCGALELSYSRLFEGLGTGCGGEDLPLECYELVSAAGKNTQRRMLRVLREMSELAQGK